MNSKKPLSSPNLLNGKALQIVKGVILHGGSGTRLRPLTYTDVKQLLPLAGKPVSEYALMSLIELEIKEVNIILGDIGSEEVRNYYGNGEKWGINISYTFQGKPAGIAQAIGLVREFVREDDFVVVLGDNYFHSGFSQLLKDFKNDEKDAYVALTEVPDPEKYGVAEIQDGRIIRMVEKPKKPKSNLAVTGVYFLRKNIFPIIDSLKPSWRGEYEITDAFQKMIESGMKVGYSIIAGWWKDTGTPEEFLKCNMMALERIPIGEIRNGQGAYWRTQIEGNVNIDTESEIVGPCFIGGGTTIRNSYIGPYTSLGRNCSVANSHIENSVIMDNVSIDLNSSSVLRESLIGPSSTIGSSGKNEKFLKFIVGRDSKIEV
jgi:glucose-1-phosphate thymidylyltransferase